MNEYHAYSSLDARGRRVVDPVLKEFENFWMAGKRPRPEDWIAKVETCYRPVVKDELIRLELAYRKIALGHWPDRDTLIHDHPELQNDFLRWLDFEIAHESTHSRFEADDSDAPSRVGQTIDRDGRPWLILLPEKGRGAQASVYRAWNCRRNRQVCVKISHGPRPDAGTTNCPFAKEAQALANVEHENVVRVYDFGTFEGCPFLVIDDIEGPTLGGRYHKDQADPLMAAEILQQIALALAAVHRCGIVHRDIKPGNILLLDGIKPILIDFGLFQLSDTWRSGDEEPTQEIAGTLAFMAPEQLGYGNGRIDARTDLFGLGGVLYFLATGRPPFPSTYTRPSGKFDQDLLHQSNYPSELIAICLKALSENPSDRFQSADELAEALQGWMAREDAHRHDSAGLVDRISTPNARRASTPAYVCNLFPRRLQDAEQIVGREGLLTRIENWLTANHDGGVYLIQGEPGIGKTGLLTKIVHLKSGCLRHFLSRGGETGHPNNCLKNLIAQLLNQFSKSLNTVDLPSQADLDHQSLSQLRSTWQRLLQLIADQKPIPDQPLVIVLDALDELMWTSRPNDEHPLGFLDTVPPGIACIVSSRTSDKTPRSSEWKLPFQLNPDTRYEIRQTDPDHRAAVQTYIERQLDDPTLQDLLRRQGLSRDGFQDDLLQRAQYNFMYLHYVFREVEQLRQSSSGQPLRSLDLRQLPAGLTAYYQDHWERLWEHQERNIKTLTVLACLTSSEDREWTVSSLSPLVGMPHEELITLLYQRWEPFLDRVLFQQGALAFYHRSYRDFLRDDPVVQATFAAHETSYDALAGQLAMQHSVDWLDT